MTIEGPATSQNSPSPGILALIASCYSIMILSEAFIMLFDSAVEGNLVDLRQPILFLLILSPLALWPAIRNVGVRDIFNFCTVLIGLAAASTLWSINPKYTVNAALALISNYIFVLFLLKTYNIDNIVRMTAGVFTVIVVCSYAMVLLWPQMGVESKANFFGAWSGVFYFKNHLGRYMALAIMFFYLRYLIDGRLVLNGVMVALAAFLLAMSSSATGVLLLFGLLSAILLSRVIRASGPALSFVMLIASSLCLLLIQDLIAVPAALELLGKDATLTGRTHIWAAALYYVGDAPWFGYGYSAFFSDAQSPVRDYFGYLSNWTEVPHAHNGLLQIALDLGVPGAVLAVSAFVSAAVLLALKARRLDNATVMFCYLTLTYIFIVNISEPSIFRFNDLSTVMFFAAFLLLAQRSQGRRSE